MEDQTHDGNQEDRARRREARALRELQRRARDFQHKSKILAEHCRNVGTDFDAITRSSNFNVVIAETEKDVADKLAWVSVQYQSLIFAETLARLTRDFANGHLVGTSEQVTERLAGLES